MSIRSDIAEAVACLGDYRKLDRALELVPELFNELAADRRELLSAVRTWLEWGGHCETCEFVRQRAANPQLDTALFADYCDCGWHAAKQAVRRMTDRDGPSCSPP